MEIINLIKEIEKYLLGDYKFTSHHSTIDEWKILVDKNNDNYYILNYIDKQLDILNELYVTKEQKIHIKSLIRNYKLELILR